MSAVLSMSTERFTAVIADSLRRRFGNSKASAKLVANLVGSNEKAAQNWINGANAPGSLHLMRLMATVPELQAEMRSLIGIDPNLDPEFERDLIALVSTYQKLKGKP